MKKLLSVLLIMVLALSLVACGKKEEGGEDKKTMKLAVVYTALGDFWDMCGKGGTQRVEELKSEYPDWTIELELTGPQEGGVTGQIQLLENLMSLKYDGILVAASDAEGLTPTINACSDAGIVMFTMDTDCPDSKRLAFVGTHNENFGRKLAQFAVDWEDKFGDTARIIVMHGAVAQLGMIQR
ncbi:MAG: substrate-binding domain-containing protein, partial [Oscillospiraceae bacterium]|nr:substrate-binding domain-containing protein [Oscillospiraceae bacterium]